ncbi:hypothetical protein QZH41_009832, partial [Actinostola sp. cb2023]
KIEEFDGQASNIHRYIERLEQYFEANGIPEDKDDAHKRRATLISVLGAKTYDISSDLCSPATPATKTYGQLKEALKSHFAPKKLIVTERYRFHNCKQEESQNEYCNPEKLLAEDYSFQDALKIAINMEMAVKDIAEVNPKPRAENQPVHKIQKKYPPSKPNTYDNAKRNEETRPSDGGRTGRFKCLSCGYDNHRREECKFRNATCRSCGLYGHITRVCKSKPVRKVDDRESEVDEQGKYPDVFKTGLGTMQGITAKLELKDGAKPKFCKARPVPYALQPTVEEEYDRLEREGIIERIEYSEWGTPMVHIPKSDGKTRSCGDYSVTLNPSLKVPQYPVPLPEDVFRKLAGGKLFSKLDLTNAYQQMLLDPESQQYVTINTHRGLYRYKRLPFGVASSPAIFQQSMDIILQGLDSVAAIQDDILITGQDDAHHLANLEHVLERLNNYGLRVKLEKCRFMQKEVIYMGVRLSAEGISPTQEKIEAITNAPVPLNTTQLRAFLGMVNYHSKFIPNLSTILQPLNQLLQKDRPWQWSTSCQNAFQSAKNTLSSSQVLVHFNPKLPVILETDASQYGVGAVIFPQIPKWYDIKYRCSKSIANADALSRLPLPYKADSSVESQLYYTIDRQLDNLPVSASAIARETAKDRVLSKVMSLTQHGWFSGPCTDDVLKPYFTRKDELSCEQGCIMWGARVIVPPSLRDRVLEELHNAHPGIAKMKAVARSYVWWPKIDVEIEGKVRNCQSCAKTRNDPPAAPLYPWCWPMKPWQRLHVDFATFSGKHYLIVVDAHSKWPEVIGPMSTTTAESTTNALRSIFSRFGLPEQIVSDNGPPSQSSEYELFLKMNGIQRVLTSPYHQSSNGQAERFVQTFKNFMKAASAAPGNLHRKIHDFLLTYRSSPNATTGVTPAKLLFGREVKTRLSLVLPNLASDVQSKQTKMKEYHDVHAKYREFTPGQNNTGKGSSFNPSTATVTERRAPYSYSVELPDGRVWNRHVDHLLKGATQTATSAMKDQPTSGTTSLTSFDMGVYNGREPEVVYSQPVQANAIEALKAEVQQLRRLHDTGSVDSALAFLRQQVARPSGVFDPHATLAALEQLVDIAREKGDTRSSRYAVILRQTRPLVSNPQFQQLVLKLTGDKDEVAIAREIQKALKHNATTRPQMAPRWMPPVQLLTGGVHLPPVTTAANAGISPGTTGLPQLPDYITDLPRYMELNHFQTTFDDKSGYDHVRLYPASATFFGLEWKGCPSCEAVLQRGLPSYFQSPPIIDNVKITISTCLRNELLHWKFLDSWSVSSLGNLRNTFASRCSLMRPTQEALALLRTLESLSGDTSNARIDAFVDNKVLLDSWIKQTSRSPAITTVMKQLFSFTMSRNLALVMHLVPSRANLADDLSRVVSDLDCTLSLTTWRQIDVTFGPHSIDMMALPSNVRTDRAGRPLRFFSQLPCPESEGTNVFAQNIAEHENCYVFPPFSLIGPLLKHLQSQGCPVSIVVPDLTPRKYWWPLICRRASSSFMLAQKAPPMSSCFPAKTRANPWTPRSLQWDLWAVNDPTTSHHAIQNSNCIEANFKPFSDRTMRRILTEMQCLG